MSFDRTVIDYKIIRGVPSSVEFSVQSLIEQGWELNGELFAMKYDTHVIAVQGMVRFSESKNDQTS